MYKVELIDNSVEPPRQMSKELINVYQSLNENYGEKQVSYSVIISWIWMYICLMFSIIFFIILAKGVYILQQEMHYGGNAKYSEL